MALRARILVVEDEPDIRRFVRMTLESEGHEVFEAPTLQRGLIEAGSRRPDLAVVDLGLPDGDGVALIRDLRGWSQAPVIVLSARSGEADKVTALDAGADDYLVKPVQLAELAARIRALLRRSHARPEPVWTHGALRFETDSRRVFWHGKPVELAPREIALLELLLASPQRVLSRATLQQRLYHFEQDIDSNALEVHVHHLRRKLYPAIVRTVRGVGYALGPAEAGGAR